MSSLPNLACSCCSHILQVEGTQEGTGTLTHAHDTSPFAQQCSIACEWGTEHCLCALQIQGSSGGTTGNCISAIIPGGDSHSVILGDNFMRAWYTVYTYDISSKTAYVGIAEAAAMTN